LKPYISIGLAFATFGITLKIGLFLLGKFDVKYLQVSNFAELALVALVPIFAAIYQYRSETKYAFDQRFKPLLGASLVCSLVLAGFAYCYFAFINPQFAQHFVMENEALLKKTAKTPEEFKKAVNFYLAHWQPFNQATSAVFGMFFVGLFSSLISAGFLGYLGKRA
jgi:hypothetical protein